MLQTFGWIVLAWMLVSLPLGVCVGAVLRRSAQVDAAHDEPPIRAAPQLGSTAEHQLVPGYQG